MKEEEQMLQIYFRLSGESFDAKRFQMSPALPEAGSVGETKSTNAQFPKLNYWKSTPIRMNVYDDEEVLRYINIYQNAIFKGAQFGQDLVCLVIYARYKRDTIGGYFFSHNIIEVLNKCGASIDIDQYYDEDS